nr:MAG TPA: hypothetical protein [Caudoviricetes sp.]
MKNSREQFEEWFDEYTFSAPGRCKTLRSGIGYRNTACQEQWEAWQASRAAIVIELPWLGKSSLMDTDDVVEAIELQGLTAKEKP